jgi:preprotein translocase subunit SecF
VEESGVYTSSATQIGNDRIRITTEPVSNDQSLKTKAALAKACDVSVEQVDVQVVGPTWGGEITKKAVQALIVFMILVSVFLAIYFTWQMALAALVALIHDIVITVGVYSLMQFEVTPGTVVGILTILGYSLYDTVVVFDKVKENTRGILGQSRYTYGQAANLAVNQTLVRSINTSIVALLPVAAILFVGAGVLGAGTLKDLSLALFVGIAAGAYSSIFIATPFLAQLMERDSQMQALARRVASRGSAPARGRATKSPAQPAAAPKVATSVAVLEAPVADSAPQSPEPQADTASDAMARARARRAGGARQQPKRSSKSKRK